MDRPHELLVVDVTRVKTLVALTTREESFDPLIEGLGREHVQSIDIQGFKHANVLSKLLTKGCRQGQTTFCIEIALVCTRHSHVRPPLGYSDGTYAGNPPACRRHQ